MQNGSRVGEARAPGGERCRGMRGVRERERGNRLDNDVEKTGERQRGEEERKKRKAGNELPRQPAGTAGGWNVG